MAGQTWDLTSAQYVNLWEKQFDLEVRGCDPLLDPDNGLAGAVNSGALITQQDQMSEGTGIYVTMKQVYQLSGSGRAGDDPLKGHGEGYKEATFNVYANTLRHAFTSSSPFAQQAVPEDILDTGRILLGDWMASRLSFGLHAHATGMSLVTNDKYRLHNTINLPNTNYIVRPNGKAANALTSSDRFDTDLINDINRLVGLVKPRIRPAITPWGAKYCVFLSREQVHDLRRSDSEWFSKMAFAAQGGKVENNGIYTRVLGEDRDFLFFETDFLPPGMDSDSSPTVGLANTRRGWVGGAGALLLAFGRGYRTNPAYSLNRFRWNYETEDFGHQVDIAATTIVGAARPRYTKPGESSARELGVVVFETYADKGGLDSATTYSEWSDAGVTISG